MVFLGANDDGYYKTGRELFKNLPKNRTMPSQVKSYKQIEPWSIIGRLDCQRKTVGGKKERYKQNQATLY